MALVLFEDEDLLVINKPAGWNTHSPGPFAGEGVYDWLKNREPRWAKLAIIHRLDKETSGVLVFGKTSVANKSLTEQFTSRAVRKKYLLLTDRILRGESLVATSVLVRAGERYLSRPPHTGAEGAETHFSVIQSRDRGALVQAEPVTGRTHQIRVHAADHGFPILGDTLYGGTEAERVFLHAAELTFKHPASSQNITFSAPCDWGSQALTERRPGLKRRLHNVRTSVIDPVQTDAWRLIHGVSDASPGLYLDKLGIYLLAQSGEPLTPKQLTLVETVARANGAHGVYHKLLTRHIRRTARDETSPQLIVGESAPERFVIRENGLNFELSFGEGYSLGLFLDQRDNRRRLIKNYIAPGFCISHEEAHSPQSREDFCASAPLRGISILNAFAYTCGFSVAAAKAGAKTTSLDLSRKYVEWGKRNFVLNGLDPTQHDFIYGDAFGWIRRLAKKERTFDGVILDPPTFSQSKESGTWQAEKDFGKLVFSALPLLKTNGILFASTNAAKLKPEEFLKTIDDAVKNAGRKILQQHYVPQPPDFPISREEPAYLKTIWLRIA